MLQYIKHNHHICYLSQHILRGLSLYISALIFVYYLGYEKYGEIAFGLSILSIVMPLSKLGIDNILINEYKQKKYDLNTIMSTSYYCCFIFNIFLSIILIIFGKLYFQNLTDTYAILILILLVNCVQTIDSYYLSHKKYFQISLIKGFGFTTGIIIKLFTCIYFMDYVYFSIIYDYLIIFMIIKLSSREISPYLNLTFISFNYLKKLIQKSYPVILSASFGYLTLKINIFIISYFYDMESVGLYNFSSVFFEGWLSILYALSVSLMPDLSKNKNNQLLLKRNIEKYLITTNRISLIILLVASLMYFFGVFHENRMQITVFIILMIGAIFFNFGYLSSKIFIIYNKTKYILLRNLILLLITALTSILLSQKFGIVGAAWSLTISLFITHFVLDLFYKENFNYLFSIKLKSMIKIFNLRKYEQK
jgi:O-antigen/teichoic acid export membrane protein